MQLDMSLDLSMKVKADPLMQSIGLIVNNIPLSAFESVGSYLLHVNNELSRVSSSESQFELILIVSTSALVDSMAIWRFEIAKYGFQQLFAYFIGYD